MNNLNNLNENKRNSIEKMIKNKDFYDLISSISSSYNQTEVNSLYTQLIVSPDSNPRPDPFNKKDPNHPEYRQLAEAAILSNSFIFIAKLNALVFPSNYDTGALRLYILEFLPDKNDIRVVDEYIILLEHRNFSRDIRIVYGDLPVESITSNSDSKNLDSNNTDILRARKIVGARDSSQQSLLIFFLLKKKVVILEEGQNIYGSVSGDMRADRFRYPEFQSFYFYKDVINLNSACFGEFEVVEGKDIDEFLKRTLERYKYTKNEFAKNNQFIEPEEPVDYMPDSLLNFKHFESFLDAKQKVENFLKKYRSKGLD